MDVELQILKHLARDAHPTVAVIDEYCEEYKDLFKEVRNDECFKYLHIGITSSIKRKSLPEIAKVVGINSAQSLHHFIANSDWSVEELRSRRLNKIKKALNGKTITVVIDETGDRKKGKKTDYVARQYLGSIGKIDNGIVSVNAYGVYRHITFPLMFKVFKPKGTLKLEDKYQTKIESDTPSGAGGLMSGTASKAGVLAKDVCVGIKIDRSYQRFPAPECTDVQPLAQSQLSRQHSPWPRNSLLENCAVVP
jgi:hypothetical protein